jgi:hypothetical protein
MNEQAGASRPTTAQMDQSERPNLGKFKPKRGKSLAVTWRVVRQTLQGDLLGNVPILIVTTIDYKKQVLQSTVKFASVFPHEFMVCQCETVYDHPQPSALGINEFLADITHCFITLYHNAVHRPEQQCANSTPQPGFSLLAML